MTDRTRNDDLPSDLPPERPKLEGPNPERPNMVEFRDIAGCMKEVVIVYEGRQYRLLETKNGKLILNR